MGCFFTGILTAHGCNLYAVLMILFLSSRWWGSGRESNREIGN